MRTEWTRQDGVNRVSGSGRIYSVWVKYMRAVVPLFGIHRWIGVELSVIVERPSFAQYLEDQIKARADELKSADFKLMQETINSFR